MSRRALPACADAVCPVRGPTVLRKVAVSPKVPMRPLYWTRIQIPSSGAAAPPAPATDDQTDPGDRWVSLLLGWRYGLAMLSSTVTEHVLCEKGTFIGSGRVVVYLNAVGSSAPHTPVFANA